MAHIEFGFIDAQRLSRVKRYCEKNNKYFSSETSSGGSDEYSCSITLRSQHGSEDTPERKKVINGLTEIISEIAPYLK